MIRDGDYVIAGVSGGADSVCLLCVLAQLQRSMSFELSALHVNHGIRGEEAARDESFTEAVCQKLGVRLEIVHADVPDFAKERRISLEEAGRIVRYEALRRAAEGLLGGCKEDGARRGSTRVRAALAHHMDDQAETVLHNMMRGSALKGLAGMQPVNEMPGMPYSVIRPLLSVQKDEITGWLSSTGQDYCTDSTNADSAYTRNRLRNTIIPMLKTDINENAVANIAGAAGFVLEADNYIEEQAAAAFERCAELSAGVPSSDALAVCLNVSKLDLEAPIIQKYVVYNALIKAAGASRDICSSHVFEVLKLAGTQPGKSVALPYSLTARRRYNDIIISGAVQPVPDGLWYSRSGWYAIDGGLITQSCDEINEEMLSIFTENDYTKCIDYDKIKVGLVLRTRQEGDYICVYGDGRKKKLKNYLIEQKVPSEYRERVLLVADGSEIVWIVGFRLSERYRVCNASGNKMLLKLCAHIQ